MLTRRCGLLAASLIVTGLTPSASAARQAVGTTAAAERPNIVLIFPDNLGWGEVGVYGSVRGVPTPRIDELAAEGIRLTNFNVEFSCVVSRAALLTGRHGGATGDGPRRRRAGIAHAQAAWP